MYCCRADIIYPITTQYYFFKHQNLLTCHNKYIYDKRWEKIFKLTLKDRKRVYRNHHLCQKHIGEINSAIRRCKGKESARQYRLQKTENKLKNKNNSNISETILIIPEPNPIYNNYSENLEISQEYF